MRKLKFRELTVKPLFSAAVVVLLLLVVSIPFIASASKVTTITVAASSITSRPSNAQPTTITTTNFLTYQNSTYGIKIQYPSDWLYKEGIASNSSVQTIVTFTSPNLVTAAPIGIGKSLVAFTVAVQSLPFHNLSLNTYTNLNVNTLRQSEPGFQLLMSNDTTLAGGNNPAHKITYTVATGMKTMAAYTIKGDKTFILEYITGSEATYSSYLPIAQKMLDSFQVTK